MKYPNTVTAWEKDDSERTARWERLLFTRCFWQERKGANPSASGDVLDHYVLVIVKGDSCSLKRGDRMTLGMSIDEDPPATSVTVNTVKSVRLRGHVDHFEVIAS